MGILYMRALLKGKDPLKFVFDPLQKCQDRAEQKRAEQKLAERGSKAQSKETFSNPMNESNGDDEPGIDNDPETGEYKDMKLANPLAEDDDGDKSEQDDADLG